jgi:hypothetical protein
MGRPLKFISYRSQVYTAIPMLPLDLAGFCVFGEPLANSTPILYQSPFFASYVSYPSRTFWLIMRCELVNVKMLILATKFSGFGVAHS